LNNLFKLLTVKKIILILLTSKKRKLIIFDLGKIERICINPGSNSKPICYLFLLFAPKRNLTASLSNGGEAAAARRRHQKEKANQY
jgi:hypothetical protein